MVTPILPPLALVLAALVVLAAFCDLRERRIPNWLTLSGLLVGFGVNCLLLGWSGCKRSAAGTCLAFVVYLLFYISRAMGAGDVKLMAAVGAFVGPGNWLIIFLITALVGGLMALLLVTWRGRLSRTFNNVQFIFAEMSHLRAPYVTREELSIKGEKAMTLPHGAAIAVGCLAFLGWQLLY